MTHYKLIVAGYNCYDMVQNCVDSIAGQTYTDYDVCLVDDASTDERQPALVEKLAKQHGWKYILREENAGTLHSQHEGITLMDPQDGNVIVWVDMDDALSSPISLERLDTYYDKETLLTYGNYQSVPYSDTCPTPERYPAECDAERSYRQLKRWGIRYNHLRTVKWDLYKRLDVETDFKINGKWMNLASDTAIMIPCLEMAGGHYKFIPEILYSYTSDNPLSEWRKAPRGTDKMHDALMAAPKKDVVELEYEQIIPTNTILDGIYDRWVEEGKPGDPNNSVPHEIKMYYLLRTIRDYKLSTLVESGTSYGDAINAIRPFVEKVYTIEAWEHAYKYSCKRFRKDPNIQLHFGDSADILPQILKQVGPSVFWLDAHYSGDGTALLDKQTPIVAELEAIAANSNDKHCIVIDDARGFGVWEDYTTFDWMRNYSAEAFPNHIFSLEGDEIFILPS